MGVPLFTNHQRQIIMMGSMDSLIMKKTLKNSHFKAHFGRGQGKLWNNLHHTKKRHTRIHKVKNTLQLVFIFLNAMQVGSVNIEAGSQLHYM